MIVSNPSLVGALPKTQISDARVFSSSSSFIQMRRRLPTRLSISPFRLSIPDELTPSLLLNTFSSNSASLRIDICRLSRSSDSTPAISSASSTCITKLRVGHPLKIPSVLLIHQTPTSLCGYAPWCCSRNLCSPPPEPLTAKAPSFPELLRSVLVHLELGTSWDLQGPTCQASRRLGSILQQRQARRREHFNGDPGENGGEPSSEPWLRKAGQTQRCLEERAALPVCSQEALCRSWE